MNRYKTLLFLYPLLLISCFLFMGCEREKPAELYHKFPGNHWARYNILSFEIPVEKVNKSIDIIFFARFTPEFIYETLDFNMVLKSAGEERINEYQMKVKSKGGMFLGKMNEDTCEIVLALKRSFNPGKPGIVVIEIENLTPRLFTEGITGVGIRMVSSGKD